MWKLLKRFYQRKKEDLTLVIWNDYELGEMESFRFKPVYLFLLTGFVALLTAVVFAALVILTPLRGYLIQTLDTTYRMELLEISNRVLAVQDSLAVREKQLNDLKSILRTTPDTLFSVSSAGSFSGDVESSNFGFQTVNFANSNANQSFLSLDASGYMAETVIRDRPVFPVAMPVEGTITAGFDADSEHYGIDIAAATGSPVRSVASGVVVHAGWSVNYGYTIKVQHGDGYLSVYKHSGLPARKVGDFISKGDILGAVSYSGILSSGPHLHFELWHNGLLLNPQNFLIN